MAGFCNEYLGIFIFFTEGLKELSLHCVDWELLLRIKKHFWDVDLKSLQEMKLLFDV